MILFLVLLACLLLTAAGFALAGALIGTLEPAPAPVVRDKLDELLEAFRPGPDWAEVDAVLYQRRPLTTRMAIAA